MEDIDTGFLIGVVIAALFVSLTFMLTDVEKGDSLTRGAKPPDKPV